jgi:hypothetical protein
VGPQATAERLHGEPAHHHRTQRHHVIPIDGVLVEQQREGRAALDQVGQPPRVGGEVHVGVVHAVERLVGPVDAADVPVQGRAQPQVEVARVR